jgi:anti-sigma regulatory factor (Ser/Thr protein kinase)
VDSRRVPDMPWGQPPARLDAASHLALPPEPASVARARAFLAQHVPPDGVAREAAELLVSELATNVVLHARTAMDVAVATQDDQVIVAVTDGSDALPRGVGAARGAAGPPESGRGMFLLDQLATDWGVAPRAKGKTIWFVVTTGS